MNKKAFLCTFAFVMSFILASCNSLWRVQDGTSISMHIDLQELVGSGSTMPVANAPSVIDGDDDDDDGAELRLTASIFSASTGKEIATRDFFIDGFDDVFEENIEFGNIPQYSTVYATFTIEEFYNGSWIFVFKSRSPDTKLSKKEVELTTYPNAAFLNYEPGAAENTSRSAGLTSFNAATRFNDAIDLLKSTGSFLPDATIYVMQAVNVENTDTTIGVKASDGGRLLDLEGVTIRRQIPTYPIFEVTTGNSLTLSGAILEGDSWASAPLISVSGTDTSSGSEVSSTVSLIDGTILQNNVNYGGGSSDTAGVDVLNGAKLIMENSAIINNMVIIPHSAAGVNIGEYPDDRAILELRGGYVFIDGNITDDRIAANVSYFLGEDPIEKTVFPVQVTGSLDASSRIGLLPFGTELYEKVNLADGTEIVVSNGGSIRLSNFNLDGQGSIKLENGNVVYTPPPVVYIGGSLGDDSKDGLTEGSPVASFARAKEIFNGQDGTIYIVGTITVNGNETWKPNSGQSIILAYDDYSTGSLVDADFTFVEVLEGASLTLENMPLNTSSITKDMFIIRGKLILKENVYLSGSADESLSTVKLEDSGTLELQSGFIRIDQRLTYNLPVDGLSSPVSVTGSFRDDSLGNPSLMDLNPLSNLTEGVVLVEKGSSTVINPDNFAMSDLNYGKSVNNNGDLVLLNIRDIVYLDGQDGDDSDFGDDESTAVKTFERAQELVGYRGAQIIVTGTININGSEIWNTNKFDFTIIRDIDFVDTLINVSSGSTLTFPSQRTDFIIDGNSNRFEANAPLIAISEGGTVNFLDGHNIILQNNNNLVGAGAILVDGGKLSLGSSSLNASVVLQNTSADEFSAITIQNGGNALLNGAYITQNNGGGVHVGSDGTLILAGETEVNGNEIIGAAVENKNISYDKPQGSGYGLFINGSLTSGSDDVIGITPPIDAQSGDIVVRKLTLSGYHPVESDFEKIFHDDESTEFTQDEVNGQLRMP